MTEKRSDHEDTRGDYKRGSPATQRPPHATGSGQQGSADPWWGEQQQQQAHAEQQRQQQAHAAQQQQNYNNAQQAHMSQQAQAYNAQQAQTLQANWAQQTAQNQAYIHSQMGFHPATMVPSAAAGFPGHMGPGGTMSSSSHAGPPVPYVHPQGWIPQTGYRYTAIGGIEKIPTGAEM
ncbi:unnamed protein product [Polarella glacialis]|uniref:Uncharacterized protein n=1 Tax=Polarella glacialis TaxID=89957 RepID=A0A813HXL9_POLGL|nr:unnamed protein product [Polarella glacialis]